MLSMSVFTFRTEKIQEVRKRRAEEVTVYEGLKIIDEWCSLETGKVFRLIEGRNPKAALAAFRRWSDLGKVEIVPVRKAEDTLRFSP